LQELHVTIPDDTADFWHHWHTEFEQNDGSLPELRLVDVPPDALSPIWRLLTGRAAAIAPTTLWREDLAQEVELEGGMDAGDFVSSGKVPFFHTVLRKVRSAGLELPELGVFCAPGEIALDYQPGPDWNQRAFLAFLALLSELLDLAPGSRVTTEPAVVDEYREGFERAFAAFRAGNAA
jgi:hypothetical protein